MVEQNLRFGCFLNSYNFRSHLCDSMKRLGLIPCSGKNSLLVLWYPPNMYIQVKQLKMLQAYVCVLKGVINDFVIKLFYSMILLTKSINYNLK